MKTTIWQRRKLSRVGARGPQRFSADTKIETNVPRPPGQTYRFDRYDEPEPMPEPSNYRKS